MDHHEYPLGRDGVTVIRPSSRWITATGRVVAVENADRIAVTYRADDGNVFRLLVSDPHFPFIFVRPK